MGCWNPAPHVVGHDVEDLAEPVRLQRFAQSGVGGLRPHFGIQPGWVHHVVAVRASRRRLQVGRTVEVADTQCMKVGHGPSDLLEGVALVELDPVGRQGNVGGVQWWQRFAEGQGGATAFGTHGRRDLRKAGMGGQFFQRHTEAAAPVGLHGLGGAWHIDLLEWPVTSSSWTAASQHGVRAR